MNTLETPESEDLRGLQSNQQDHHTYSLLSMSLTQVQVFLTWSSLLEAASALFLRSMAVWRLVSSSRGGARLDPSSG